MNIDPKIISEVLSKETAGEEVIEAVVVGDNVIINTIMYVNKYELLHKCKEYIKERFYFETHIFRNGAYLCIYEYTNGGETRSFTHIVDFENNNDEFEAVIKAAKWVSDNKDKQ